MTAFSMSGRILTITTHDRQPLHSGWQLRSCAAGSVTDPANLDDTSWLPALAPGTVASSLQANSCWSLDGTPRRFDAEDWWYRVRFDVQSLEPQERRVLGFDGLATLAEVWLDGKLLLQSRNMFVAHELDLGWLEPGTHELAIRFLSLDAALQQRRPRPRWRAPMIENQQLRWVRTTVLGRTPGWSPPAAAVGPWRSIWVERRHHVDIRNVQLRTELADRTGTISLSCRAAALGDRPIAGATLLCGRDGRIHAAQLEYRAGDDTIAGCLSVQDPELWWPHTHGTPATYDASLHIQLEDGTVIAVDLGCVGFRTLLLDDNGGDGFEVRINDTAIFCRGACWTPLDPVTLTADEAAYRQTLDQVVAGGFNTLRVSGTMVYETDALLRLCDRLGVMVWHDFMFANMDYPHSDPDFIASVDVEARQQLARLQAHPCLVTLCGNSEVSQQAAMWGAPRELWNPTLFAEYLRDLAHEYCPGVPYWPSSAHGGSFPHQANCGTTSYYGVGAYLRPLDDARRSQVRFATECLAFANVPAAPTIDTLAGMLAIKVHHPRWKERVPRDLGAGWDFEDVRDHYLERLFGIDPVRLRSTDHQRYLELSRVVTGEVMAQAFAEWRREDATCRGALVWFLKDLWPGAGWGIIDAAGRPKAAYYYLKRALQPISVALSDEGVNGLWLHIRNETGAGLDCRLDLVAYRDCSVPVAKATASLHLPSRSHTNRSALSMLDNFMDLSYAYRFGPPAQDLVVATLCSDDGAPLGQGFFFPSGLPAERRDIGLTGTAHRVSSNEVRLTLCSEKFAQSVHIDAGHYQASDQYFHIPPRSSRDITLRSGADNPAAAFAATVTALNSVSPRTIEVLE